MRRRYRLVSVLIASAALAGVCATGAPGKFWRVNGTFQRSITFRWPASANQTAFYSYRFSSPHVRSITFRSYGATISPGLAGDQLVACLHRGPASLNWAWSQAGNGLVTLKVRAITGACDPGPSVAGTLGSVTLTIVTDSGTPGQISAGQASGGGGYSAPGVRLKHATVYWPGRKLSCELTDDPANPIGPACTVASLTTRTPSTWTRAASSTSARPQLIASAASQRARRRLPWAAR